MSLLWFGWFQTARSFVADDAAFCCEQRDTVRDEVELEVNTISKHYSSSCLVYITYLQSKCEQV